MSNSVNLALDVTKTGIQNPLIKVRQGDGGFETLRTTVTANGEPMDLQGWNITFMGTTAGNHKIVDGNVTLVETPNGIFDYTPSKTWGMDIGDFKIAYFKFVKGDGSASSANFRVSVIEAVDLTQEEAQHYISVVDATIAEAREHLESSLADVSSSVAATSSAVSSMAVFVSSTASSAVSQANSAASNASVVASSAVAAVSAASNTYVKDTRHASGITDFNLVMGKTWSGKWYKTGAHWSNEPTGASNYLQFEYTSADNDSSGILEIRDWTTNRHWVRTVSAGTWSNWVELANDYNVVHKTGTETIAGDKTFTSPINGQLSGNASTATKWQTARTLALTGDVTGSVAMDGSGNVSMATTGANLVHKTGNETIAGDKTFTGQLKVSGDNYANTASVDVNYLGATISFVRIGKLVTFTSGVSAFNTNVSAGLTSNVIPNGFKPAVQQNISPANQSGASNFFSFDQGGGIYSYGTYPSGAQPRLSWTYITTDAWPV